MSYGRWWIDFEDLCVTHTDTDGLPTVQATGVDLNLSTREKPAHGQHFYSSLAVPLLFPLYGHKVLGRHIGKRGPGLNVISLFDKPASY